MSRVAWRVLACSDVSKLHLRCYDTAFVYEGHIELGGKTKGFVSMQIARAYRYTPWTRFIERDVRHP